MEKKSLPSELPIAATRHQKFLEAVVTMTRWQDFSKENLRHNGVYQDVPVTLRPMDLTYNNLFAL